MRRLSAVTLSGLAGIQRPGTNAAVQRPGSAVRSHTQVGIGRACNKCGPLSRERQRQGNVLFHGTFAPRMAIEPNAGRVRKIHPTLDGWRSKKGNN